MMHCPLCQDAAHARLSRYLSTEMKERYHQCQNINYGCTFVTHENLARFIVKPDETVPAPPRPNTSNNSSGSKTCSGRFFIACSLWSFLDTWRSAWTIHGHPNEKRG
ncbi:ogr/Delta-like zinc finger family protein [Enterobacter cloacae]|nr:ogr/Delta-like zinc finger family protein [Enterobacter cloacae]HED5644878.1 ogr/Delta-like zinc finger family protein [Enterobacter cloacae]